mgnify:FL=1
MENWANLGGKEGRTNIQRISAKQEIEHGALWLEERDLINYFNYLARNAIKKPHQ